jgi:cysteine synthase
MLLGSNQFENQDRIENILDLIGNTPIKKLTNVKGGKKSGSIWAKLEYLNPSGSIKDRIALQMIEDAEKEGKLKKGYTITESSSGNTAIALSFVGGVKGYKRIIYLPQGVAEEKIKIIKLYGADVHVIDIKEDLSETSMHGGYVEIPGRTMCKKLEENNPNVWWARQFSNPSNYKAHMKLAEEIIRQMGDIQIDAFIASVGTGGTLFGISKVLKKHNPHIQIIAVEPANAQAMTLTNLKVIPGVTGGIMSEILKSNIVDRFVKLKEEEAIEMYYRLIREEGTYTGVSAGANVCIAKKIAEELGEKANIVTVLPDRADRYISSTHYVT